MPTSILPGTENIDSLNLQANLIVGGTMSVAGSQTYNGTVSFGSGGSVGFNGPVVMNGPLTVVGTHTVVGGLLSPVSRFTGAGTVTIPSGIVNLDAAVAGFTVQLPAPVAGADYDIVCHTAPSSATDTISIPAGGTIYGLSFIDNVASGSRLAFGTAGQRVRLVGLGTTQYQIVHNQGTVVLS